MSKMTRKQQRETIFELLFETEFHTEADAEKVYEISSENREFAEDEYIKDVYFGVRKNISVIDAIIEKYSKGWKTSRMSKISRSVIRLCVYEMMYQDSIPVNVSLNEAVELSKKFDDEKARPFVNGVLNSIKNDLPTLKDTFLTSAENNQNNSIECDADDKKDNMEKSADDEEKIENAEKIVLEPEAEEK